MAKILVCTGIFPPHVGGPAQYAKEVVDEFRRQGHTVKVLTYGLERKLPTLIRHKLFFWRTLFSSGGVDFVLALDTFSVGWPATVAAKISGKKIIVRTGGDFLWESYVERTGDLILFRNFYEKSLGKFNIREKFIFNITKWTLKNMNAVIFSTDWQKDIFEKAYGLDPRKDFIVENFYGEKLPAVQRSNRTFLGIARILKWKNLERLKQAFDEAKKADPSLSLDLTNIPYAEWVEKIKAGYAAILVSLGDISPNMIMDALRANTPFILTRETGLYEKLKDVALFVDPENVQDITEKILLLADKTRYEEQKKKVESFTFTHSWNQIANEILDIVKKVA